MYGNTKEPAQPAKLQDLRMVFAIEYGQRFCTDLVNQCLHMPERNIFE